MGKEKWMAAACCCAVLAAVGIGLALWHPWDAGAPGVPASEEPMEASDAPGNGESPDVGAGDDAQNAATGTWADRPREIIHGGDGVDYVRGELGVFSWRALPRTVCVRSSTNSDARGTAAAAGRRWI